MTHPTRLPHPTPSPAPSLDALVHWFEHLTPQSLAELDRHYAADARFKDPFNDVQGHAAIHAVFEHMFASLHAPRFVVTGRVQQGQQAFLTWDFVFRFRRFDTTTEQTICGATQLVLDAAGLVTLHRDHWDAAEELYEKLPVVGSLMRWLKRRAMHAPNTRP
jgi:ketosteroid isomerase-like protein